MIINSFDQENYWFLGLAQIIIFLSFFTLFLRSFQLNIVRGHYYYERSENNRLRKIDLPAPRGRIISENGLVIADNLLLYADSEGSFLEREDGLFKKAAGEKVIDVLRRRYPLGEEAAHLSGYLGEANEEELGKSRCLEPKIEYQLGDLVGRGGLEEEYDCYLTGEKGEKLVEVNSQEQIVRELGRKEALPGQDLIVSLDLDLQNFIWEKMKERKGAVVVLEPKTGQILALVSAPSFEPNAFGLARNEVKIKAYLEDQENTPFLNRALAGSYHPGSVFKPFVALAALAQEKITPQMTIEDTGVIKIGEWQYRNWYWTEYGRTEGEVDLIKGMQRSNDIYFYKIGELTGAEKIVSWARKFGFGEKTGIDLPAESRGLLPSPEWKKKVKGESWFLGNTYHLAIGQGDLTVTPLQMAVAVAAIISDGQLCPPGLKIGEKRECENLGIKKEYLEAVRQGMVAACLPGGTGFPFFDFEPLVGCKTGTAEIDGISDETHAWFTFFAPAVDAKIVTVVFLERGGGGAYEAGPIARQIAQFLKEREYF